MFSRLDVRGDAAVGGDLGELGLHLRRVVAHARGRRAMISERSTVTTVRPEACSSFSLKRIVWKAPVRAPIEPIRAFFRPRTTRQTRTKRSRSAANSSPSTSRGVAGRVGERDAVLVEIVGDRELAAEGVAAAGDVDLVDLVVARLQQDRHVELRRVDELHDGDFVAEVRQADDQAVDRVALLRENARRSAGRRRATAPRRSSSLRSAGC